MKNWIPINNCNIGNSHAVISSSVFSGQPESPACIGRKWHWLHIFPRQSPDRKEHGFLVLPHESICQTPCVPKWFSNHLSGHGYYPVIFFLCVSHTFFFFQREDNSLFLYFMLVLLSSRWDSLRNPFLKLDAMSQVHRQTYCLSGWQGLLHYYTSYGLDAEDRRVEPQVIHLVSHPWQVSAICFQVCPTGCDCKDVWGSRLG